MQERYILSVERQVRKVERRVQSVERQLFALDLFTQNIEKQIYKTRADYSKSRENNTIVEKEESKPWVSTLLREMDKTNAENGNANNCIFELNTHLFNP